MAYIESFFYYILVVVFMFIVIYGIIILVYMLLGQLKIFFSKEEITWEIEKNFLYKLIKNKFFKLTIVVYILAFVFFYISSSINYYGKDRAYPQAKAYKIVADLVLFHYDFFISHRNLYYRPIGLKLIEPYQKIQEYLMKKSFIHIPQDDAERAIWLYEYYCSQYIRAMAAPIDFEKLSPDDLGYILRIGGHTAIYKPQAREMLKEVESILDDLIDRPIKDKRYDEVERYMTTILFTQWWNKFGYLHYTLGVRTVLETVSKKYNETTTEWTDDLEYLNKLEKISSYLDIIKERIDNSEVLQKMMKKYKLIYPDLMGLRVNLVSNLTYADMQYNDISCENTMLKKYLVLKTEFLEYANTSHHYLQLKGKERWLHRHLVNSGIYDYVLFKYCSIEKKDLEFERDILIRWDMSSNQIARKTKKIIEGFKNGR